MISNIMARWIAVTLVANLNEGKKPRIVNALQNNPHVVNSALKKVLWSYVFRFKKTYGDLDLLKNIDEDKLCKQVLQRLPQVLQ